MRTCPSRKASYQQNESPTVKKLQNHLSATKRKSFTVYSALTQSKLSQIKMQPSFDLKTKTKLQLHNKNQIKPSLLENEDKKQFENAKENNVKINLNLCGAKFCEVNIDNSHPFCDQISAESTKDDKLSRVLYMSQSPKLLSSQVKKPQSAVHLLNKCQSSGKNRSFAPKFFQLETKTSIKTSPYKQQSKPMSEFNQGKRQNKIYTEIQFKKPFKMPVSNFDSIVKDQQSQILWKNNNQNQVYYPNIEKPFQKKNSFSIVNFSTIGHSNGDISSWSQCSYNNLLQSQQNAEKISKLKEIYINNQLQTVNQNSHTQRTTSSYQYDQVYRSSPKNVPEITNHTSFYLPRPSQSTPILDKSKTSLDILNKNAQEKQDSSSQKMETPRSIIEKLKDWDCQSQVFLSGFSSHQMKLGDSQLSLNPQRSIYSSQIKMYKPFSSPFNSKLNR